MDNTDNRKFIEDSYNRARVYGMCKTKGEFAQLIGVHKSTLSAVGSGKSSGKVAAKKASEWLDQYEAERKALLNTSFPVLNELTFAEKAGYEAIVKEMVEKKEFDWDAFRAEAAKCIIGPVAVHMWDRCSTEMIAKEAISIANELIKQLRDGK